MKRMKNSASGCLAGGLLIFFLLCFSVCNFYTALHEGDSLISDLKNEGSLSECIEEIDEFTQEQFLLRCPIINSYGFIQDLLGKNETGSFDIVRDRNGSLYSGNFYAGFGKGQQSLAVTMRRFCDFSAEYSDFSAMVLLPMKTVSPDAAYAGIPYDDRRTESSLMSSWMRYYNVPYLNLSSLPEENGLGLEGSFYRTDSRWTTPACFSAYCRILDWLDCSADAVLEGTAATCMPDSYRLETYPEAMFGRRAQRIGTAYSGGAEDFSVLLPDDEGEYSIEMYDGSKLKNRSGGFSEVLLDLTSLSDTGKNLYKSSAYDLVFLSGLHDFCSVTNHALPNAARILIIGDSFSTPLGALLAQNCSRLDMLDITGSYAAEIPALLKENDYDIVLVCLTETSCTARQFAPLEVQAYEP